MAEFVNLCAQKQYKVRREANCRGLFILPSLLSHLDAPKSLHLDNRIANVLHPEIKLITKTQNMLYCYLFHSKVSHLKHYTKTYEITRKACHYNGFFPSPVVVGSSSSSRITDQSSQDFSSSKCLI
nr:unnamed protein product [Callosobruchus analis]